MDLDFNPPHMRSDNVIPLPPQAQGKKPPPTNENAPSGKQGANQKRLNSIDEIDNTEPDAKIKGGERCLVVSPEAEIAGEVILVQTNKAFRDGMKADLPVIHLDDFGNQWSEADKKRLQDKNIVFYTDDRKWLKDTLSQIVGYLTIMHVMIPTPAGLKSDHDEKIDTLKPFLGVEEIDKFFPETERDGITASDLWEKEHAELQWIVKGHIPEGLTAFCGPPKLGKSFFCMQLAFWIAQGRPAFGSLHVDAGDVYYMALEDSERRVKARMKSLFPDGKQRGLNNIKFRTMSDDSLFLLESLEQKIEEWAEGCKNPRLLILDTLQNVMPPKKRNESDYEYLSRALSPLRRIANEYGFSLIFVHHTKKDISSKDPFGSILGSTAYSSVPDCAMIMGRGKSGIEDATLYGRGRDVDQFEIALSCDQDMHWSIITDADTQKLSTVQRSIVEALKDEESLSPKNIAERTGQKPNTIRQTLGRMVTAGTIKKIGAQYALPS